jgi:putative transposase
VAPEQGVAALERCVTGTGAGRRRSTGKPQCCHLGQSVGQDDRKRGPRGFDGGKLVKGRKRFVLVDSLGLLLKVLVTEANIGERDGATWLLSSLGQRFPRLVLIWVDGGFSGEAFAAHIAKDCQLTIEVVKRSDDLKGFVLLPRRWVVERTFAWLGNYRRLSKDYEYSVYSSDAMIYAAMIHLMVRRLARKRAA